MIKEIGIGYGFDFNTVNHCFKKFDKDMKNLNLKLDKFKQINDKKEEPKINLSKEEKQTQKDELKSTINDIWNNNSNKEVIERLVKIIDELSIKGKKRKKHI